MSDDRRDVHETPSAVDAEVADAETLLPAVDIYETDDGAVLVADLPGCDDGRVGLSVEDGVLTVRGRATAAEPEGLELSSAEYRAGTYERTFTLSELVDPDHIAATVKDGVLRLRLPRTEAAKPKRIAVTRG